MNPFPQPRHLSEGATRWSPADVLAWEKSRGLDLPPLAGMASVQQLAQRYGVCVSTIWRWAQHARKANGRAVA